MASGPPNGRGFELIPKGLRVIAIGFIRWLMRKNNSWYEAEPMRRTCGTHLFVVEYHGLTSTAICLTLFERFSLSAFLKFTRITGAPHSMLLSSSSFQTQIQMIKVFLKGEFEGESFLFTKSYPLTVLFLKNLIALSGEPP